MNFWGFLGLTLLLSGILSGFVAYYSIMETYFR